MSDPDDENGNLVIDEVLCYVQNKMKIIDVDVIVQLCETAWKPDVIEKAKERLFDLCFEENDKTERKTRIGQHKSERNICDIYSLLEEKCENAPIFVARNLNILPPVTIKSLDVSLLLHNNKVLQAEVNAMKRAMELQKQTSEDIFDMVKAMDMRLKHVEKGGVPTGLPIKPSGSDNDNDHDSGGSDGSNGDDAANNGSNASISAGGNGKAASGNGNAVLHKDLLTHMHNHL